MCSAWVASLREEAARVKPHSFARMRSFANSSAGLLFGGVGLGDPAGRPVFADWWEVAVERCTSCSTNSSGSCKINSRPYLEERVGAEPDALVFTSPTGSPLRYGNFMPSVWKPTLVNLGLPDVGIHVLRHSAAAALIRRGGPQLLCRRSSATAAPPSPSPCADTSSMRISIWWPRASISRGPLRNSCGRLVRPRRSG